VQAKLNLYDRGSCQIMSVPRCRQSIFPVGYRMNIPYTITMGMGVAPIMQLWSEHYWRLLTRRPLSALRALPHRTAHFKNSSQPLWKSGGLHMTSFADSCMRTHAHMQSHGHMGLPGSDFLFHLQGLPAARLVPRCPIGTKL
jgi:hypothetical protein